MAEVLTREEMIRRIVEVGRRDHRIAGLVDYGSNGGLALDQWSDIDVAVFLHDTQFEAFVLALSEWLAQLGEPLLLINNVNSVRSFTRAVFDTEQLPLRVDIVYYYLGEMSTALHWPQEPKADKVNVLYDATNGELTSCMRQLPNSDLHPSDLQETFELTARYFWYFLLESVCKLQRGDHWYTSYFFHNAVVPRLIYLIRLHEGAISRWFVNPRLKGLEQALSPEIMTRLNTCLPDTASPKGMTDAIKNTATLATEVCRNVAARHGYVWPEALAERVEKALAQC
ncbi:aminoglycoside 6-adenylyltransferase [Ktedonobacter robiniae]|uniref:Polymerase nucleotidyl transferase domain-containing protein n=1 Tax=Ktedonobacter robiniae TaxID=2778365 RepID=A0ABQ3UR54_9CHLR|nr:aminoglycoside 6-adenylyltransferase [Ktedonobacter robiniae]GHO54852.1 hypothetical protein KSB_33270 [Ktedonobacter robiniae]